MRLFCGSSLLQRFANPCKYITHCIQYCFILKTNHTYALCFQEILTRLVFCHLSAVNVTIYLDDEVSLSAIEIHNEAANTILTTKFRTIKLAVAQRLP